MVENPDLLIVGAGPSGCVIAERAARELSWSSIVVESRKHIAGMCYDYYHSSGVLIHAFGPHLFRCKTETLKNYLSSFTEWIPGNYQIQAEVKGTLYPFPINLNTLEKFFQRKFDEESARDFLKEKQENFQEPKNSEEFVLSRVGRELYEAFYLEYTKKMWGRHPRELAPSVCGRIPIHFDRNASYVNERFQIMPKGGFTKLFQKMLDHSLISVRLKTPYEEIKKNIQPKRTLVYTGPVDRFFDYRFGKLPWRSLHFDIQHHKKEWFQSGISINYPDKRPYTRSVEFKHITGQKHPETVVSFETPTDTGDPYYPVPSTESQIQYQRYKKLVEAHKQKEKVYFTGRLANYTYINTDQAIEMALETFEEMKKDLVNG